MSVTRLPDERQTTKHSSENSKREKLALLLGRVVFFASLLLIITVAIPYGSVESWWASFFELGVFTIAALWVMESVIGDGFQWQRWGWVFFPAAALILFSLIQTIPLSRAAASSVPGNSIWYAISADPFETRNFALRIAALTLLGAVLLRFTTSHARLQALVFTVIGVGAASSAFGIMRQAMQHSDLGFVLPALPRGIGYGQIISRNQFAFMMEMTLGMALGLVFRRGGRYETYLLYLSLAFPLVVALILANSRGGILTMMCQLLFMALLVVPASLVHGENNAKAHRPTRRGRLLVTVAARAVLVVALLGITAIAVVWIGGERVVGNLSTVSEELAPEDAPTRWNTRRVDIWRATWDMIKDHPLTGVGFGGYWTDIPRYHDASGAYTPQQAHNDYLEIVASGGVIGVAIFIWLVVVLQHRFRKTLLQGRSFRRAACFGALIGLFGVAVHSIFDFGVHLTINSVLCIALIVIGTTEVQNERETLVKSGNHNPFGREAWS